MKSFLQKTPWAVQLALVAAAAAALTAGCSPATNVLSVSDLSTAISTASTAGGTLLCAPAQAQLDACASKAVGDACTLPPPPDGRPAPAATCRATVDGKSVGCVPSPPAPPQAQIDACTGKAAGAACSYTEHDGDTDTGSCGTARDGTTVACLHIHAPPQADIDACTGKAAGDACTHAEGRGHDGQADGGAATEAGVCSTGPSATGVLACAEVQGLLPDATAACAGLAAGATCSIAFEHHHQGSASGACTTPSAGGAPVCVVACNALGGGFGGHGDHDGDHGGGPGHGGHR